MPVTIDGETYEIDRDHLETLIDRGNPMAPLARAALRLDESEQDQDGASRGTASQTASAG
jgi:hypothetical protein